MNDIRAPSSSHDNNWNYIALSPFSIIYQQTPILDKFNTLRFERYNGTTNPDKHLQHFLAFMMICNASDVELCLLFPSSLRDTALCWLASLSSQMDIRFSRLGTKIPPLFCGTKRDHPSFRSFTYCPATSI